MISEVQKSKKDNVVALSPLIDNFLIKWIFLPWLVLQTCRNQRETYWKSIWRITIIYLKSTEGWFQSKKI